MSLASVLSTQWRPITEEGQRPPLALGDRRDLVQRPAGPDREGALSAGQLDALVGEPDAERPARVLLRVGQLDVPPSLRRAAPPYRSWCSACSSPTP